MNVLGIQISAYQIYKITKYVASGILCIVKRELDELTYAQKTSLVLKEVEIEKKKLISNKDLVQEKIEATDRKTEKVNDVVFEWQKEMENLLQEVETLTLKAEPGTMDAFRELTDDEAVRYRKEILNKLKALNIKCEFEPFSSLIPGIEHFSYGNFVCFEPIKEASDRLLEALRDDNFCKIGLYGKRGSGKTKLVKAVGEKAKYSRMFDVVLFLTVSPNPNVRRMQDEIADSLNLNFDANSEIGRARTLYSTLGSIDRRILVILDDVRANLDLEDVGIPCNSNSNRCKILLTTRLQQECALMNCQKEVPLYPLSIEETWTLLKRHSWIDDESPSDLLNVAREVAIECQGLPGMIKNVGSSLRIKPIEEWKTSLDNLRYSMARYHIFLSFRGKDIRYSFIGFLYDALCREGFKTFMDDGGLKVGDGISSSLIKAIEASRISIVVFSENYAHSSWCLDELVTILKCKKMKNQLVWPVFYKVEASDVRHQKNSYEKAMAKHEKMYESDYEKVKEWRSALFEVAGFSGLTHKTGYDYKLIETIVEMANNIKNRLYIHSLDMD